MPVTTEDLAYMAGVIDSDGYIGIVKQSETRRKHTTEYFRTVITVSQVQLEAIELLRERLGGSFGITQRQKGSNWKSLYRWGVYNKKDTKRILEMLLPYLKIKRKQAEMVIAYCELREDALKEKKSSKNTYSGAEKIMWLDIKQLNQVGTIA